MNNYNYTYKLIVTGDSGVGKSSLCKQYSSEKFDAKHDFTIGVDMFSKIVDLSNTKVKLQIWDTAGQERFRSIISSYYRDVICAIIVYDISCAKSFENTKKWLEYVKSMSHQDTLIVLVGNKNDKNNDRQVSYNNGLNFAKENNMLFFEASSKDYNSVKAIFDEIAIKITVKILDKLIVPNKTNGIRVSMHEFTHLGHININKTNTNNMNNTSCCNMM